MTDAEAAARTLKAIKVVHTIAWAILGGCVLAIPVVSWQGNHRAAAWLSGIIAVETIVLLANGWRCPLTSLAARYTDDRHDNFDIYLPEWFARHNKTIFGTLYILGVAYALSQWLGA